MGEPGRCRREDDRDQEAGDVLSWTTADCVLKTPEDRAHAGLAFAVVTLTGCRPMTLKDEKAACCRLYPRAHAWVFTDIKRIEPIPVKGSLGIFDCPLEPEDLTYIGR